MFAVFIFWFFGRNLDWSEIWEKLRQANAAYLFAATLIICLGYFLRALRWRALLEPITETSLTDLFAATTVGFTAVFLIGRAGEIVRPMWLPIRDPRVRPSAALVTLFLERICDLAALVCFFAVSLLWLTPPAGREKDFAYVKTVGFVMLVGVGVGIVMLWLCQKFSAQIIVWLEDRRLIQNKIGRIFLSVLKQLATALQILRNGREVLAVVGWTIAVWVGIAVPTWLVIRAFGLPMSLADSVFVMFAASMGSVVPTPGGAAGAFHAAAAGGLIFLGVDKEQATAVSIALHLIYFAPAIIFGIYYFLHGDISIARFRNLLSSEHAVEEIESESPNAEPETDLNFESQL